MEDGDLSEDMKKVIFVCHGSICRSPAAEAIFLQEIKKRGKEKEFACFSYALSNEEIGNDIYPPMKRELFAQKIPFEHHSARRLTQEDLDSCDYLFYMDSSNESRFHSMYHDPKGKGKPIYAYTPSIQEIEDPWYTGRYQKVVEQMRICIHDILDFLG